MVLSRNQSNISRNAPFEVHRLALAMMLVENFVVGRSSILYWERFIQNDTISDLSTLRSRS